MAGVRRLPWPDHVKVGGVSLLCHKAPGLEGKLIMGDGRISHGYFMFMSYFTFNGRAYRQVAACSCLISSLIGFILTELC